MKVRNFTHIYIRLFLPLTYICMTTNMKPSPIKYPISNTLTWNHTKTKMIIHTLSISGTWVEIVCDRNKQALLYDNHAGSTEVDTMTGQNTGGHIGVNKTAEKISSRYYWSNITGDV